MSRAPPRIPSPFPSHRSISVRQQKVQQHSPRLRRSTSAYNGVEQDEAAAVEVGSTGPIHLLLGRDSSVARRSDAEAASRNADAARLRIWQHRLWLILPAARSKRRNATTQPPKSGNLETAEESKRENGVPRWKRVLQKLRGGGGSNNSKVKGKARDSASDRSEESSFDRCLSVRMNKTVIKTDFAHACSPAGEATGPPSHMHLPPPSPLIWERRNFAQISPLDLSHLHTSRLKKALESSG